MLWLGKQPGALVRQQHGPRLSAGVTTRCAAGKNSRPQPRTRRLCLVPSGVIFMQIFMYRFTMPATAGLMILMSPEERAALDAKARAIGVSAGEVVRRAVQAFELGTEEEAAELRTLIEAFNELHPETLRIADECHRKAAETLAWPSTRDQPARRRKETATA